VAWLLRLSLDYITIRVNGVRIGFAYLEDFFHKYGNCDGENLVGLVAEAYFVRRLRSLGYEVRFVISHNIEVRWIKRGDFAYECVDEYGKVLEKMPSELKAIVQELCEKGIDILIEDDGNVPVYFKEKLLFKKDVKRLLNEIISKHRDAYITTEIIFDEEFEPFLAALGMELIYRLDYRLKTYLHKLPPDRFEEVLEYVEKVLAEKGVRLDEEFCTSLKISNEEELAKELLRLAPLGRSPGQYGVY